MLANRREIFESGCRAVGVTLATLSGCASEASGPTGSHVDVHVHGDGVEFCAGTVEHLDRFVEHVFAFLEEPIPDDFVVPIEVFSAQQPRRSPLR